MAASAEKSDPKLWDKIKSEVTSSDKGGKPGQWSARKAQAATKAYKEAGGGYKGRKSKDNSLTQWSNEEWDTKSGEPSSETGERYLPKKARSSLSKEEYDRSTRKKRADTKKREAVFQSAEGHSRESGLRPERWIQVPQGLGWAHQGPTDGAGPIGKYPRSLEYVEGRVAESASCLLTVGGLIDPTLPWHRG